MIRSVHGLSAICGARVVKRLQSSRYDKLGGRANSVKHGYTKGDGLGVEIFGTFVLVYTGFSATDVKRNVRDSHAPCSWFSWKPSPSQEQALILLGALV
ncbi:hypothetical protein V6N13_008739 [Hibiscus sabdariffa]